MPKPTIPDCPPELGPVAQCEWQRLAGELSTLRILTNLDRAALAAYCGAYALGRSNAKHPEVRHHGEIALWLSDPVAICRHRQSSGRDFDAHRIGVRIYPREPKQNFDASARITDAV